MSDPVIKAKLVLDTSGSSGSNKSSGSGGVFGGGSFKGMMGLFAKIAGAAMIVAEISKVAFSGTMKVLSGILKMVGLLLKPLGDILAIGLMPLIFMLKPLAQVVNVLFKPYLRAAMVAMKAGNVFQAKGDMGKAAESYGMGFMALIKPFFDLFVSLIVINLEILVSALQVILTPLAAMLSILVGFFTGINPETLFAGFIAGFDMLRFKIAEIGGEIITITNEMIFGKIEELASDIGLDINLRTEELNTMWSTFLGTFTVAISVWTDTLSMNIGTFFGLSKDKVITSLTDMWTKLKDMAPQKTKEMLDAMIAAFNQKIASVGLAGSMSAGRKAGGPYAEEEYVPREITSWGELTKPGGKVIDVFAKKQPVKSTKKVKDAIITKTGQVINTDPNDNIMASKNGFGSNISVNVQLNALDASSINSSLINKLTSEISNKLKREMQGRSSYGIGV